MNNPIGVIIIKYIKAITIGAIILPSNSPNFTQTTFNGFKSFELSKPKTKKITEIGIGHNLNGFPLIIGQKAIIAKTNAKKYTKASIGANLVH